jgi:hypothetical protein
LPAYPILRLQLRLACHGLLFGLAPICRRSFTSLPTGIRRTTIHLLARLAVSAMWVSSAAAFDATHTSRLTVASMGGRHSLQPGRHETGLTFGQSVSAAVEAPSFRTTGCAYRAKSQPASQREVEVQLGDAEEIGEQ